jgi:hypothetical protein
LHEPKPEMGNEEEEEVVVSELEAHVLHQVHAGCMRTEACEVIVCHNLVAYNDTQIEVGLCGARGEPPDLEHRGSTPGLLGEHLR